MCIYCLHSGQSEHPAHLHLADHGLVFPAHHDPHAFGFGGGGGAIGLGGTTTLKNSLVSRKNASRTGSYSFLYARFAVSKESKSLPLPYGP